LARESAFIPPCRLEIRTICHESGDQAIGIADRGGPIKRAEMNQEPRKK